MKPINWMMIATMALIANMLVAQPALTDEKKDSGTAPTAIPASVGGALFKAHNENVVSLCYEAGYVALVTMKIIPFFDQKETALTIVQYDDNIGFTISPPVRLGKMQAWPAIDCYVDHVQLGSDIFSIPKIGTPELRGHTDTVPSSRFPMLEPGNIDVLTRKSLPCANCRHRYEIALLNFEDNHVVNGGGEIVHYKEVILYEFFDWDVTRFVMLDSRIGSETID